MAELRRVPGTRVYGGTQALKEGIAKIAKDKCIVFNVDLEDNDVKELPSFKVPFEPEKAFPFSSFDEIIKALNPEDDKTQCVFNAKNIEAATTGMVAACVVKAVQSINMMKSLVEEGIAEKDWIQAIITNTFETVASPKEGESQLDVVSALLKRFPEMEVGKILVDKLIDLAGETGPHLRRCVAAAQAKMEAAQGGEQEATKKTLLNYIERYFYLVCFGAYCRQEGPGKFQKSFVSWLEERKEIAEMVDKGIRVWEEMTFFSLNMSLPA